MLRVFVLLFDACCCVWFSVVCCCLAVVCLVVRRLLRVGCWLPWMRGVLFAVCWLLLCVGDLCCGCAWLVVGRCLLIAAC